MVEKATARVDNARLTRLLFQHPETKLRNIKFCRGTKDVISREEIDDAVHRAVLAKRSGSLPVLMAFPDIQRNRVDVRHLVKNL